MQRSIFVVTLGLALLLVLGGCNNGDELTLGNIGGEVAAADAADTATSSTGALRAERGADALQQMKASLSVDAISNVVGGVAATVPVPVDVTGSDNLASDIFQRITVDSWNQTDPAWFDAFEKFGGTLQCNVEVMPGPGNGAEQTFVITSEMHVQLAAGVYDFLPLADSGFTIKKSDTFLLFDVALVSGEMLKGSTAYTEQGFTPTREVPIDNTIVEIETVYELTYNQVMLANSFDPCLVPEEVVEVVSAGGSTIGGSVGTIDNLTPPAPPSLLLYYVSGTAEEANRTLTFTGLNSEFLGGYLYMQDGKTQRWLAEMFTAQPHITGVCMSSEYAGGYNQTGALTGKFGGGNVPWGTIVNHQFCVDVTDGTATLSEANNTLLASVPSFEVMKTVPMSQWEENDVYVQITYIVEMGSATYLARLPESDFFGSPVTNEHMFVFGPAF